MKLFDYFKNKRKRKNDGLFETNVRLTKTTIKREGIMPKRLNSNRTITNKNVALKFDMDVRHVRMLIRKGLLKTNNGKVTVKSAWTYWYENLRGGGRTYWEQI